MYFSAESSDDFSRPLVQKEKYFPGPALQHYLLQQNRTASLGFCYADLQDYRYTDSLKDDRGKHTHWERVVYHSDRNSALHPRLVSAYFSLCEKAGIRITDPGGLQITAIDFCEYANSMPFRITLTDRSGKSDSFFVKQADASRIYGLELEHLLSHPDISFICMGDTLVEQEITGVFADTYLQGSGQLPQSEKRQAARAFAAFNLRCFVRLLGDMRSYNFVLQKSGEAQLFFRAIDFDQQTYEGNTALYFSHAYSENQTLVNWVQELLPEDEIVSIEQDAITAMRRSAAEHPGRLLRLLEIISSDEITEHYKFLQLRNGLVHYHRSDAFAKCSTMGGLLRQQLHHFGIC